MSKVFPVIMCGGSGTRLWPLSRPSRPKQFARIIDGRSLFENTVLRLVGIKNFDRLVVITNHNQTALVTKQLDGLGVKADIILEPEGRDSAAAVACAALYVRKLDNDGVAMIVASDHHIVDEQQFQRDMGLASKVSASEGKIVVLGIRPTHASESYGYVLPDSFNKQVAGVKTFEEKPSIERASEFIELGYRWNSGNFVATANTLIEEFQAHPESAEILQYVEKGFANASIRGRSVSLGTEFLEAPKQAFDRAVMERTKKAAVISSDFGWSDLGTWDSLKDTLHENVESDPTGTVLEGDVTVLESQNCYVRAESGKKVVLIGIENQNVIVDGDVVLVCKRDSSNQLKRVVDELKHSGSDFYDVKHEKKSVSDHAHQLDIWLRTAALPLWASAGFDLQRNIWVEELAHDGRPTKKPVRARVQGRQKFVFAKAGNFGWHGNWSDLIARSAEGAENIYGAKSGFLNRYSHASDQAENTDVLLYDQAFQLLALAEAAKLGDQNAKSTTSQLPEVALGQAMMENIIAKFGDQETGLFRATESSGWLSNPNMHLFEALLAWVEATRNSSLDDSRWMMSAEKLVNSALKFFVDPETGALREIFDQNWKINSNGQGSFIEPGHQFEWAWLLMKWKQLSSDESVAPIAKKLFEIGLSGEDFQTSAIVTTIDETLTLRSDVARLWPQTEWLKASLILCAEYPNDHANYFAQIEKSIATLTRFLNTPVRGLWRDKLLSSNTFIDEPAPASSFYHLVVAIEELRNFAANEA